MIPTAIFAVRLRDVLQHGVGVGLLSQQTMILLNNDLTQGNAGIGRHDDRCFSALLHDVILSVPITEECIWS